MTVRIDSRAPVVLAALVALLCVLGARPAHASPGYPGQLSKDLGLPCAPPCTVCHRDRNGGLYTVDKPFGLSMYAAGLRGQSPDGLRAAEKSLESTTPPTDSDGDGVGDIQELKDGTDPNSSDNANLCNEGPAYGCGAHVAPRSRIDGLGALLGALAGFVLLVGMRRRRG